MEHRFNDWIQFSDHVALAFSGRQPMVSLESTVISHGLPYPENLEAATECELLVRSEGAVPASVGIVGGIPKLGLGRDELRVFAERRAPNGAAIEKVSLNNMAAVIAGRAWAATTVAATIRIASLGGLVFDKAPRPLVFATGGIGGVHRGASDSLDISADLTALATTQIVCVCAGAKAILDLPKTREYLETMGIPVVGFQTEEFPAFYSRSSGLRVDVSVDTPDQAADLALTHWRTGSNTSVLVCVPIPEEDEIQAATLNELIETAYGQAATSGISGRDLTPFLLSRIAEATEGKALRSNRVLLGNNAKVAALIAVSLSRRLYS